MKLMRAAVWATLLPMAPAMAAPEVLMVLTSEAEMGETGKATGFWLSEAAHPFHYLEERGAEITLASIAGGKAPIDPGSLADLDAVSQEFLDAQQAQLAVTPALAEIATEQYDAIILVGGHGTMWDFRGNQALQNAVANTWQQGGSVAAVCHGVAGLVDVSINGTPLIADKAVTGFSNSEESAIELTDVVPYALEDALKAQGADYSQGADFTSHVVVDGRLITAQNPFSSTEMAEALWTQIQDK